MAELAGMPTISETATWCDFEESDDLAGPLPLLRAKTTTKTRIFATTRFLGVDDSEMAMAPARSYGPKREVSGRAEEALGTQR